MIPTPFLKRPRVLPAVVLTALLLAACGGGDEEPGVAAASGVSRSLCAAFLDLSRNFLGKDRADIMANLAAAESDSQAVLELLPDDAPKGVRSFFEGFVEMAGLARVWTNEAGGIKEEYVDDLVRVTGLTTGEGADATERYIKTKCFPGGTSDPDADLDGFFQNTDPSVPRRSSGGSAPTTVPPEPATVTTLLGDGPSGTYEQVTVDVAKVTATNAEPAKAFSDDPVDSTATSVLVELELSTNQSSTNRFAAPDFQLVDPSGKAVSGRSVISPNGELTSFELRGRDSSSGVVVFPTTAMAKGISGYVLRLDRDSRVPLTLPLSGPVPAPYPVELEAGGKGAFEVRVGAGCTDRYETAVRSIAADLDADLGDPKGIERAARGQRWVRVALDVTNVSSCEAFRAFSGNYAGVELRMDAGGRLSASDADKSFDRIEPGTTAERIEIFAVDAKTTALVLTGPGGEVLGRWSARLPAAPGEA